MRKVDTAWLRMDSPSNLMMINGVWCVSPGISLQALRERASERLLQYPRFRQCAVEDATGASWVDDAQFDITAHVVPYHFGAAHRSKPAGGAARARGGAGHAALDRQRPLWQFHLIEDFVGDDGQPASALILRIHHCIADGIALIAVALSLVDGSAQPPGARRQPRRSRPVRPHAGGPDHAGRADYGGAGDCAAQSLQWLLQPEKILSTGLAGSHSAAHWPSNWFSDAAALAFCPMTPHAAQRHAGHHQARGLVPAHCAGRGQSHWPGAELLGQRCADVVRGGCAGQLPAPPRRGHRGHRNPRHGASQPARIPGTHWELGNHFGLAPLLLPLGMTNPIERVYEVRQRMNALKGSLQPLLSLGLLAVVARCTKAPRTPCCNGSATRPPPWSPTCPALSEPLVLCGARVTQCMFWVPQSGNVGLGVSILSYGGGVQFGVMSDTRLCPSSRSTSSTPFAPQFEQLSLLTLMLPWGE